MSTVNVKTILDSGKIHAYENEISTLDVVIDFLEDF